METSHGKKVGFQDKKATLHSRSHAQEVGVADSRMALWATQNCTVFIVFKVLKAGESRRPNEKRQEHEGRMNSKLSQAYAHPVLLTVSHHSTGTYPVATAGVYNVPS